MSAANIHLLDDASGYVDLGSFNENTLLPIVFNFCKENPDQRPIDAIDQFIRQSPKLSGEEWTKGTVKWTQ